MDTTRKILIVDDEAGVRGLLSSALAARGFTCHAAASGARALARLARDEYAVVLTDLRMPGIDGVELLERVKAHHPLIQVIIITGVFELCRGVEAMRAGAFDYVTKPFTIEGVVLAVERALRQRDLEIQNQHLQEHLEAEVELRTLALLESNQRLQDLVISMIYTLTAVLEAKDPFTRGHSERVAAHAVAIAEHLGLPEAERRHLELAGLLHDIGKLGVAEAILQKPGSLTDEEYQEIQAHAALAEQMLGDVETFAPIVGPVRHHHERFDGLGYPDGLRGDRVSLAARILSVCDAYDAMTSERPYRASYGHEHACAEIRRCAGTQFDPAVADAFLEVVMPAGPAAGAV